MIDELFWNCAITMLFDVCYFIVACIFFAFVSYIDICKHVIHNTMLLALICAKLLYLLGKASSLGWFDALMGLFIVAIVVLPAAMFTGSVGAGDLKMCIVMGFCVGLKLLPCSLLLSLVSIVLFVLLMRKCRKQKIPFAPFAAIGTCGGLIYVFFM